MENASKGITDAAATAVAFFMNVLLSDFIPDDSVNVKKQSYKKKKPPDHTALKREKKKKDLWFFNYPEFAWNSFVSQGK